MKASFNKDNINSLTSAIAINDVTAVKALLAKDIDIKEKTSFGSTVLIEAAYNGRNEIAELLIEKGVDLNAQNKQGYTALIWATIVGNHQTVKLLLKHGAKTSITDNNGKTALQHAQSDKYLLHMLETAAKLEKDQLIALRSKAVTKRTVKYKPPIKFG